MRKRDVRWSARVGLCAALVYGGAQLACSSGDDSSSGTGGADAAAGTDATATTTHDASGADVEDAGACVPMGPVPQAGTLKFTPNGSGACTPDQLAKVFSACFGAVPNASECSALAANEANATCYACIQGPSTAALLAPILVQPLDGGGAFPWTNTAGCIAALDPAEEECAEANALADTCEYNQCLGCSEGDLQPIAADPYGQQDVCFNAATDGPCAALQSVETACDQRLMTGEAALAPCFSPYADGGPALVPGFLAYIALVCGPPDAGTPDASSADAAPLDAGADAVADAVADAGD